MALPSDLAAREKRTSGVFLAMLGAGLIIDRSAVWVGGALLIAGIALLAVGLLFERRGAPSTIPVPSEQGP